MFYVIYQTTNLLDGKVYVGKHKTQVLDDKYLGSGLHLRRAIRAHGKENFHKKILFVFDNEDDMTHKEIEIVTEEFCLRDDTYNIALGGQGGGIFKGHSHTDGTRRKMSIARKGVKALGGEDHPMWGKFGSDNPNFGSKRSDEVKMNMSKAQKGKPKSEEFKSKVSKTLKGKPKTDSMREKLSRSLKGKPKSEETKQRMREAYLRRKMVS